jgi:cytochrome c oxidase subunit IV
MSKQATALLVVAMVAVIIGVDFAFFRHRFWERLAVNIAIVIAFGAVYFIFRRRS